MIAGSQISVIPGGADRLFLKGFGDNEYLREAGDLTRWRQDKLPRLVANYLARHRRMAERGIPFVVVFGPEASGIYPEHLPEGFKVETPTACEILAEELIKHGVNVVCPSQALRQAKGPVDVCLKLDSHWSNFGAYICYLQIIDALDPKYAAARVPWQSIFYEEKIGYGDLGVQISPERKGYVQHVSVAIEGIQTSKNVFDIRDKNLRQSKNPNGVGRALIYRDSFTNALGPFFEATFAETYLVAPAPIMLDSAIDAIKPDVVILEVAERALFGYEGDFSDWSVRNFEQEYRELADNPVSGRLQVQALKAIYAGEFDEAIALAAMAIAKEGSAPRVYNLAWALNKKGRHDLCYKFTSQHADELNDAFIYYLQADSAAWLGDINAALTAIEKALLIYPRHALFLYLRGEWLLQMGNADAAVTSLSQSLGYAPLHARSWTRLIEALETLGRHEEAEENRLEYNRILGGDRSA